MKRALYILLLLPMLVTAKDNARLTKKDADDAVDYIRKNVQQTIIMRCGCCTTDTIRKVLLDYISVRTSNEKGFYELYLDGMDLSENLVSQPVDVTNLWIPRGDSAYNLASLLKLEAKPCAHPIVVPKRVSNDPPVSTAFAPQPLTNLKSFLAKNLRYPEAAKAKRIQGTVILRMIIKEDGSMSNIRAITRLGGGLEDEAIRVVKLLPPWRPAMQYGKPIKVNYSLPIDFTLTEKK